MNINGIPAGLALSRYNTTHGIKGGWRGLLALLVTTTSSVKRAAGAGTLEKGSEGAGCCGHDSGLVCVCDVFIHNILHRDLCRVIRVIRVIRVVLEEVEMRVVST